MTSLRTILIKPRPAKLQPTMQLDLSSQRTAFDQLSLPILILFNRYQTPCHSDNPGSQKLLTEALSPEPADTPRAMKKRKLEFSTPKDDPPTAFFSSPSPFTGVMVDSTRFTLKAVRPNFDFRTIRTVNLNRYTYAQAPPTTSDLIGNLSDNNIASKIYRAPYYSKDSDVPEKSREYAGLVYHIKGGTGITNLDEWKSDLDLQQVALPTESKVSTIFEDIVGWEYAGYPPGAKQVRAWLTSKEGILHLKDRPIKSRSQVCLLPNFSKKNISNANRLKVLPKQISMA